MFLGCTTSVHFKENDATLSIDQLITIVNTVGCEMNGVGIVYAVNCDIRVNPGFYIENLPTYLVNLECPYHDKPNIPHLIIKQNGKHFSIN
jgi:hypothetical protein